MTMQPVGRLKSPHIGWKLLVGRRFHSKIPAGCLSDEQLRVKMDVVSKIIQNLLWVGPGQKQALEVNQTSVCLMCL